LPVFISRPAAPEEEIELEGGLKAGEEMSKGELIHHDHHDILGGFVSNMCYFHPYLGR